MPYSIESLLIDIMIIYYSSITCTYVILYYHSDIIKK